MERSLCVYDEILLEAPHEATDEVAPILKETMEDAGRTILKIIPVEAQVVAVDSFDLIGTSLIPILFSQKA